MQLSEANAFWIFANDPSDSRWFCLDNLPPYLLDLENALSALALHPQPRGTHHFTRWNLGFGFDHATA